MTPLLRWLSLVLLCTLFLQVFFVLRIACLVVLDPVSTTFQRSEAVRLWRESGHLRWRQQWVPYEQISVQLKRAVIASEDDGFTQHMGVQWDAVEKAWKKNEAAAARVSSPAVARTGSLVRERAPKIIGGSTITQQLAKNLLLSGERHLLRKAQELMLTLLLEAFLSKQRILEIYLNSVEWGEGVFGAEAAAQHYFAKPAGKLNGTEAARLAVMLPRPKYFEKLPNSAYLAARSAAIAARMGSAALP
jgi:monofunctional biosynthetic peptidoglycan transglycosylase